MEAKKFLFVIATLVTINVAAQPIITNAELFSLGTQLSVLDCDTVGVTEGNSGANVIWDFSSLVGYGAAISVEMMDPSNSTYGSLFPNADMVEKWSDGRLVFTENTSATSKLVGFVDSLQNLSIHYPKSMLFSKRPFGYGDSLSSNYTDAFNSNGIDFKGGGTVLLEGDSYGTLMLPNKTYQNVLRVKMTQIEIDTLIQYGTTSEFTTITYLWFDGVTSAALLKINYTITDTETKSVSYLLDQVVGIENEPMTFTTSIYPNPCKGSFVFKTSEIGQILIFDEVGKLVKEVVVNHDENKIQISNLPSGLYYLKFYNLNGICQMRRLIIN